MEKLQGKNVLLVGATGGIGSNTAKMLAASGVNLFLTGRSKEKLDSLAIECHLSSDHIFQMDVSNKHEVEALSKKIHYKIPSVDILIIASGIGIIKPVESLSPEEFLLTIQTNLLGPFLLVKSFLPKMKEQNKGLIINIPGVLGKTPMAGAAAYAASKYGLNGMMKSIREEIKRTEIRITNVFMGGVNSAFWDTIDLKVQREKMIMEEEAARSIWFLCQQPRSAVVSEMVLQPFNHQAI